MDRPSLADFVKKPKTAIELDLERAKGAFEALRGPQGEKGEKGDKGETGEAGYTPIKGVDYYTPSEIDAILEMATPIKGKHYRDGIDGKNGKDVDEDIIVSRILDKIPTPKDGKDGKNGKSPTIAAVLKKLLENKIPLEHIEGLPEKFEEVYSNLRRRGGSNIQMGGPNQFLLKVAGVEVGRFPSIDFISGVNITTSGQGDNATAKVSVTASGGGTGTWYNLTGNIDGVNKVFTLPVTPASAIYLVLARQPQMPTDDYTISGDTVTYVTAPDISLSGQPHKAFVIS